MKKKKTENLIESLNADTQHNIQVGGRDILRYAKEIVDSYKSYTEYWDYIWYNLSLEGYNCGSMSDLDILATWLDVFKTDDNKLIKED